MGDRDQDDLDPDLLGEHEDVLRQLDMCRRAQERILKDLAIPLKSRSPPRIDGYRDLKSVGQGGQGEVYWAVQESTGQPGAVKVLRWAQFPSATACRRFQREVELIGALSHPNIVKIHDAGETEECVYYAMEFVDGEPLNARCRELSIEETHRLFLKVCQAMAYAHQRGVIHRDLKPTNILVDRVGEPHVLDFGLAKSLGVMRGRGTPFLARSTAPRPT